MAKARFHSLDGLRGVCALSVVLLHSETLFNAGVVFCHGYLAVDMFFILSGFVIAASYDARLADGLTPWQFLILRVRRLAPVYWAGLAMCVGAGLLSAFYLPSAPVPRVLLFGVMGIALIPYLATGVFAYPANPVAWTLAWELIVNIVYAKWLRRIASGPLLLLILLLFVPAIAEAQVNPRGWSFGMTGGDVWLGGLRTFPEFLIGVVLFRGFRRGLFDRLPEVSPLLPLAAWLVIAALPQNLPVSLDAALVLFACPLLVALLLRGEGQAPAWFEPLGAISYPLYASHLAWIGLAQHTPLFGLNHHPDPLRAGLVLLLAAAGAWLLHRLLEAPAPRQNPAKPALSEAGL